MEEISRLGSLIKSVFFFSNFSFRSNGPLPMSAIRVRVCRVVEFNRNLSYRLPFLPGGISYLLLMSSIKLNPIGIYIYI